MTEEPTSPVAPTPGDSSQSLPPESPATDSTEAPSPLPPPTPDADAAAETAEQADARKRLKDAVAEFEGALEEVVAAELDPLAELHAAGFSIGGELPPVDAGGPGDETATALGHVPEGQLPPV